jgi:Xaa-Pro aminopeptidase
LQQVRAIKSAEELTALAHAARSTDAGLLAALDGLQAGVLDRELQVRMQLAAVDSGGDLPRHPLLGMGPLEEARPPSLPRGRAGEAGDVLIAELAGSWQGYEAPAVQVAVLGPLPGDWRDAWRVHLEAWDRGWERLQPYTGVEEIDRAARRASAGRYTVSLEIAGSGLGDDLPCFPTGLDERNRPEPAVLQEGMCLTIKPAVRWGAPRSRHYLTWSDTIVLTAAGPRRLGTRPHELTVR